MGIAGNPGVEPSDDLLGLRWHFTGPGHGKKARRSGGLRRSAQRQSRSPERIHGLWHHSMVQQLGDIPGVLAQEIVDDLESALEQFGKIARSEHEWIENVRAVLKRGMDGVYHHASPKYLRRYIGEFTFRLNGGNVKRHTPEQLDSLINPTIGHRLTYAGLTA